jgi:peptidyl-prolyl cis-trans isomerase B (cyclophilin B)
VRDGTEFISPLQAADSEVAVIETTEGKMVLEFWTDVAPKTVENFKKLAKKGFYDGTAFHRIINGLLAQGGDPLTKDPSKENHGEQADQVTPSKRNSITRPHQLGVISMMRTANPDSAGSQFFICLGNAPQFNGKFTAFGKLKSGVDVLQKIGQTPVKATTNGERSKPTKRVEIKSIKIQKADSPSNNDFTQ